MKTLAGERLPLTTLTTGGRPYDRIVQVHGPEGVRTSRKHYQFLGLRDPDTLERDSEVLRDSGRRFGGRLALNADVVRGGDIRVGDP